VGWLKDKYGLSWQVFPTVLPQMLSDPDPEKAGRVMEAMLKMKKIVIDDLKRRLCRESNWKSQTLITTGGPLADPAGQKLGCPGLSGNSRSRMSQRRQLVSLRA
jgi:hypothetical protein